MLSHWLCNRNEGKHQSVLQSVVCTALSHTLTPSCVPLYHPSASHYPPPPPLSVPHRLGSRGWQPCLPRGRLRHSLAARRCHGHRTAVVPAVPAQLEGHDACHVRRAGEGGGGGGGRKCRGGQDASEWHARRGVGRVMGGRLH